MYCIPLVYMKIPAFDSLVWGSLRHTPIMYVHDVSFSTAEDCSTLPDPANGQVNDTAGTTFEQTATYSCNTGYNLVGNSTRMCQATGVWSGSAPTCEGMLLLNCKLTRVYMMYPSFQQL